MDGINIEFLLYYDIREYEYKSLIKDLSDKTFDVIPNWYLLLSWKPYLITYIESHEWSKFNNKR